MDFPLYVAWLISLSLWELVAKGNLSVPHPRRAAAASPRAGTPLLSPWAQQPPSHSPAWLLATGSLGSAQEWHLVGTLAHLARPADRLGLTAEGSLVLTHPLRGDLQATCPRIMTGLFS